MSTVKAELVKELRERTGLGILECKKALVESNNDIEVAIDNLRKQAGLKTVKKADRVAAEGVVKLKVSDDGSFAALIEVNCETDFAARSEDFLNFANLVIQQVFENKSASIKETPLEEMRESLIHKVGEKITINRVELVHGGVIGGYVHLNDKIGVIVKLEGGTTTVAKDIAMHVAATNPKVVNSSEMPVHLIEKEKEIIRAQPDMLSKPQAIVEKMIEGRINKFLKENSLVDQSFVKSPDTTVGKIAQNSGGKVVSFIRVAVGEGIDKPVTDFAAEVAAQVSGAKQ